jgi:group I intron endonuclease
MNNFIELIYNESTIMFDGKIIPVIPVNVKNNHELRGFLRKKSGIYCWFNTKNQKIYIGSSVCLWRRFLSYKNSFITKKRNNVKLIKAFSKDPSRIKFCILKILNNDKTVLKHHEQELIDSFLPFDNRGYNISKSAFRPLHCGITKKGRQKIKERHTGENSEMSKLKNDDILAIKASLANGVKLKDLSQKYCVSTTVISNIKRGLTWAHIKSSPEIEAKLKDLAKKNKHFLTKDLVLKIKQDFANGLRSFEIAKKYGLIYSTVHSIKNGHIYNYITYDEAIE